MIALKISQKGHGVVDYPTVAGNWFKDREWAKKVNPELFAEIERRDEQDFKMLKRRKH